jgi:hypothetical protein
MSVMQFRWVIVISLWAILSGPVFNRPPSRGVSQAHHPSSNLERVSR